MTSEAVLRLVGSIVTFMNAPRGLRVRFFLLVFLLEGKSRSLESAIVLTQHADQPRPEHPVLLAVDHQFGKLPRVWVAPERTMWSIIRELVADGVTIFLTSQNLKEADQLPDRIAVLDQRRLVAQALPTSSSQIPRTHVRLRFTTAAETRRLGTE